MNQRPKDQSILDHIQQLVSEEHRIYAQSSRSDAEQDRAAKSEIELDQCWDLLRQRRALRETGHNPNEAQVRPAEVVERYEQ